MTPKEVYIPVPYNENLKSDDLYVAFKPFKTPRVDFWLEKKELFVLTKEELEKVFEAGILEGKLRRQPFTADRPYKYFNDWLNTQK